VLPGLAHHRTVSGAPGKIDFKLFTFGFPRRSSAIIHRTVRCATGLSGAQRSNDHLRATVNSESEQCRTVHAVEVRAGVQRGTGLSGVAPDCPVPHEDKASNGRPAPTLRKKMSWRHTGQCPVAHRTVRCAIASSLLQRLHFGWWL
jgi:hypothetical protein